MTEVISYLATTLGVRVSSYRPENPPSEMVTVLRSGGTGDRFLDNPLILIHAWSTTDVGAYELADRAVKAMLELPDHSNNIALVEQNSFYSNAYTDGTPRWSALMQCVCNR